MENKEKTTTPEMPDIDVLFELADLFKVFGDSTRLRIMYTIRKMKCRCSTLLKLSAWSKAQFPTNCVC